MKWMQALNVLFFVVASFVCVMIHANPVTIGTSPNFPPLASLSDGKSHFYGFEVEMMSQVCKLLQMDCVFIAVETPQVMADLQSGRIDFAVAGIVTHSQIPAGFIFSTPYLESNGQFMTLATSSIVTPSDLVGKTVGIRNGTFGNSDNIKDLLVATYQDQFRIVPYESIDDLLQALSDGKIDAIFALDLGLKYWHTSNSGLYRLVGNPLSLGLGFSIMTTDKKQAELNQINTALELMKADGSFDKILKTYFSDLK